ncbi:double-strand break repair helicase AddA [Devosia albogilva]|uniref:DNA 3'-5' helicase n=1 Tax=Devosia albogilva TaxID=429726 RepID=A0ABW5QK50_9HYPH
MSDRGKLSVPASTQRFQAQSADPRQSIWVGANAGSGKTFVLTQRVLRLLLSGAQPQSILCLTYTKAAAAEMRGRVAQRLAEWAVMPEAELLRELRKLEGPAAPKLLERARTLFAHALETPGGLKIVTIHAFCESVLHRFPLEAGVPFDFAVIEEEERAGLVRSAREAVLAEGLRGEGAAEAVLTLFDRLSNFQIEEAVDLALSDMRRLKSVLDDVAGSKRRLRWLVGEVSGSAEQLRHDMTEASLLTAADIREVVALCDGKPEGRRFVDLLARLDPERPTPRLLRAAFLTGDGKPRALGTAALRGKYPAVFARLEAEQERIIGLVEALARAELVERSEALLDVVAAIVSRYERHKRARSLLDFDDLVERLGDLFADRAVGAWVQYKLDAGIDHILVDEGQDTNPEQWRVVRSVVEEFIDNAGAASRPRSFFAVGDQKQSIYSFQGAEPALFGDTGRRFGMAAKQVGIPFADVPLRTSFRTLKEILAAVDKVAALPEVWPALLETDQVQHEAAREQVGGSVTLWPPVQQQPPAVRAGQWPLEPATGAERTAPRQLAERIAREIKGWIKAKRPLAGRGRPIGPDDVMVLVQSRGAVFQEIIRALRREGLPTPGADRLEVTTHIAVLDLMALCDVLLNPADDLQLAALLRSPLFDVSEDDLYQVARGRQRTLWRALRDCAVPACADAYGRLRRWRGELDFERPFEFLSQVLYAEGGLKRFHARLGEEVDDVFAELLELALAHEQTEQPSLQGFVAALRRTEVSIKRELAEAGSGVRVMTVHGAKGLEAPIVILADAASKPQGRQTSRPVYVLPSAPGPLLVHAANRAQHVADSQAVRDTVEAALLQEYWRKLYVGMTRAEDELYVTGALTQTGSLDGTWYDAVERALRPDCEVVTGDDGAETALIYPAERTPPQPVSRPTEAPPAQRQPLSLEAVAEPVRAPVVTPSTAGKGGSAGGRMGALDTAAERVRDAETARKEGIAVHALLQHLGRFEPAEWREVIPRALMSLVPESAAHHAVIAERAIRILENPAHRRLFGPGSRAEVPFLLEAERDGKPIRLAGRFDRLVVDDSGVLVVDYKSDASVPTEVGAVPGNYRTQLGLYALVAGQLFPGKPVAAAILWTELESLMNLPPEMLAAASRGFTMR